MPKYPNSPFTPPTVLIKGVPSYLFGSFDDKVGSTQLYVTKVALATNVATVTVQWMNGPMPQVGNLISIINTTTGTGEFNVKRAVITAVDIDDKTGAGTISFALTGTDVSATNDAGSVIVEPTETAQTLVAEASVAVAVPFCEGDGQFTVPVAVTFPTMPTAVTVTLQKAIRDVEKEYTDTNAVVTVASSAYTAGPVVEATLERGYFYRLNATALTGTGTIVGKVG